MKQFLFILILLILSHTGVTQNSQCAGASPFCTGQTMQFPAGVNAGSAQGGPNYGCLGSQPNPAWFYFQMGTSGPVVITMQAGSDIDYIAYGPFTNQTGNCGNLTAANTVGCSFSGSSTETLTINNAVAGSFYILMITNFSNINQQITFSQTNSNNANAGVTNCGVLCSMTVTGTSSLCPGKTGTLSATTGTGVTSVTWSGPGGYSASGLNATIPNITTTGVYTAQATTTGTNTCKITKTITVLPVPNPIPTNNGPVCPGKPVNLSVGAAASYTWNGPNGFASNVQNPIVNPAVAGTYTVKVTSAAGCTNVAVTTVSVKPSPTATPNNNGPVCAGTTLALTGSGGGTYSWSGPNGFSSIAQNPNINNVTTAASGVYSLIVTVSTCTHIATTSATIHPAPVPVIGSNSPVCVNKPINLTSGGGVTYAWSGPGGFSSTQQNNTIASASPSNSGVYTVSVTSSNGCMRTATTNVIISPLPVVTPNNPTVCLNANINLTSNGGSGYVWTGPNGYTSGAQNPVIANASTVMAGSYTVVVTTAQGCTNSAVANVTVLALPTPSISNNIPCIGSTLTFTASGGATYNWSGPNGFTSTSQTPSITNVTAAANGVYTLIASAGTCSASITKQITMNPLPAATVTSNSGVCLNTQLNLSSGGGTSYSWVGPNSFTATTQNTSITSAQLNNAGVYSVTVTDANGCVRTVTTNVVVNSLPVLTVNNPTVCANQSINLTATGANTYAWGGPAGYSSQVQNPSIPNASTLMAGPYNVIGTSAAGCTASATSTVTVYSLPIPTFTNNTPCVGSNLVFVSSGGASYVWSGPNGFTSAVQNPSISNVSLAANGIYTLTATIGICSNSISNSVTVNALPNPVINSNSSVCLNQALTFTATGGTLYSWIGPNGYTNNGNVINIASAALSNSGTYSVVTTDANGCVNSTTANAVVNTLPVIAAVGSTVCVPQNVNLSATGGVTFSWTGPLGFASNVQSPIINNSTTGMSGIYYVTVTDANGCVSTSLTGVQVNAIPSPTISNNTPVCANQTIMLAAGAPGLITYAWTGPNNYVSILQNPKIQPATANMSGTYTVSITDNIGCSSSATVNMLVNPLPLGEISSAKNAGCVPFCTTFTNQATTGLQSNVWDFGNGIVTSGNTSATCFNTPGIFTVNTVYTDINGCSNKSTYTIDAYPLPRADFNFAPQKPVVNEDVYFTDASYNGNLTSWAWNFSHLTNSIVTQQNPQLIYTQAGSYAIALIVTTDKGCKDTITKSVFVGEDYGLYVPNAFTPNGDGINDVFYPKGFGIVTYELNIFDRWGEKIFNTRSFSEGWAGNYQGRNDESVPLGVYVWHITLKNVYGKIVELTGKVLVER